MKAQRYGPGRVITRPTARQPGDANVFDGLTGALEGVRQWIRPVAVEEAKKRGEAEAIRDTADLDYGVTMERAAGRVEKVAAETGGPAIDWAAFSEDGATRPDAITGLDQRFRGGLAEMLLAASAEGFEIKLGSAYRSAERQASLWAEALAKYGTEAEARKWVAPPGRSQHNFGRAADLRYGNDAARAWAHDNAGRFGLAFPLSNEDWHVEAADARGGGAGAAKPAAGLSGPGATGTPPAAGSGARSPHDRAELEVESINATTFEPRVPFTVSSAAYNAMASRRIGAAALSNLSMKVEAAILAADGDMGKLTEGLNKARSEVIAGLPESLPELKAAVGEAFERERIAAMRSAVDLTIKRQYESDKAAMTSLLSQTTRATQRLALTGAEPEEIAAHLAQSRRALAAYGPREAFSVNGVEFAADPSRAGMLTADEIGASIREMESAAALTAIEADFARSDAPGAYVRELRSAILSGEIPVDPGASLKLLSTLEARVRAMDSARRGEEGREAKRVEEAANALLGPYLRMQEAGVFIPIPKEEQGRIRAILEGRPDLLEAAEIQFQKAETLAMVGQMGKAELSAWVQRERESLEDAAASGALDPVRASVLADMAKRAAALKSTVTESTIGLSVPEQILRSGRIPEGMDYDAMRAQAADDPDLLRRIDVLERTHKAVARLEHMTAAQRDDVERALGEQIRALQAEGKISGSALVQQQKVIDEVEKWSDGRSALAETDPVEYGRMRGVEMAEIPGDATAAQAGATIAANAAELARWTSDEGVAHPLPLNSAQAQAITEMLEGAPVSARLGFIGAIQSGLPPKHAGAILDALGQGDATLGMAAEIYAGGNRPAATAILRSSGGKITVRTADVVQARGAVGVPSLVATGVLDGDAMGELEDTALAYAKGIALSEGAAEVTVDHLEEGFQVAAGRQDDGTGGLVDTRDYGVTVAPPGWDRKRIAGALANLSADALAVSTFGEAGPIEIMDATGRVMPLDEVESLITALRPDPEDPHVFIPMDVANGGARVMVGRMRTAFGDDEIGVVKIDLRALEGASVVAPSGRRAKPPAPVGGAPTVRGFSIGERMTR